MPRERSVQAGARCSAARFDRVMEFVNLLLALAMVGGAWVLVVELLAWSYRHDHRVR
jgi:hypothetical protein